MIEANNRKQACLIRLKNVGVSYARRGGYFRKQNYWGIKDVSFHINHGESLGVIGRNGAGKSTLLKLIAGIIKPDRGEVQSEAITASLLSLQVGFLPQLTGRENAILSGMLLGIARRDVENNMDEIVRFAELEDFIDQPLHSYSAGMKARLGFAVSFQFDPDVLLVDEVLGVGDFEFRQRSAQLMMDKIKSDKTVVLVSHNTAMVRQLCDRAVWIEDGQTRLEGPTNDVVTQYEQYVASRSKRNK